MSHGRAARPFGGDEPPSSGWAARALAIALPLGDPARLLAAFALVAGAVLTNNGAGPFGVPLLLGAAALVASVIRRPSARPAPVKWLAGLVLLLAALSLLRPPAVDLGRFSIRLPVAFATLSIAAAAVIAAWKPRFARPAALAILCVYLAAGAMVVRASPNPAIDVFAIEQGGARDLLAGRDPYLSTFANPYNPADTRAFFGDDRKVLDNYPYPPLSLLATLPGYAVAGDIRWSLLVAQLATAAGLWWLARRSGASAPFATTLLALQLGHPRGLFVLQQAWTEPLVAAALVAALIAITVSKRAIVVGLAIGGLLAMKQYSVLLLPLLIAGRAGVPRRAWPIALTSALALTLPFVLWDAPAFSTDVILMQLRQPFRMDALSLPPIIAFLTGWQAPGVLCLGVAAGALALGWRRLPAGASGIALGGAALFLALFLTAKQAFCNYYYFVGVLLLAAAGTAPARDPA